MNTKGDKCQTKEPKSSKDFLPNEYIQPINQQLTNVAKEPKPLK
jgi:hypothetical protein